MTREKAKQEIKDMLKSPVTFSLREFQAETDNKGKFGKNVVESILEELKNEGWVISVSKRGQYRLEYIQ